MTEDDLTFLDDVSEDQWETFAEAIHLPIECWSFFSVDAKRVLHIHRNQFYEANRYHHYLESLTP